MLVLAIVAVFLAGLMVGRTPEYLGKKIGRQEITLVALYVLTMPAIVLVGVRDRRLDARPGWPVSCRADRTGSPRSSTRSPPRGTTTAPRSRG